MRSLAGAEGQLGGGQWKIRGLARAALPVGYILDLAFIVMGLCFSN